MANPIRNFAVARGQLAVGETRSIFTVPENCVLLLKDIRVSVNSGTTPLWYVFLQPFGSSAQVSLIFGETWSGTTHGWAGWLAMNAQDQISMGIADVSINYWVSGALLPFVPGQAVT